MADSYNELFNLAGHSGYTAPAMWWLCQDDAASATVNAQVGYDGALDQSNTEDISTTGPHASGNETWLPLSLDLRSATEPEDEIIPDTLFEISSNDGFTLLLRYYWDGSNSEDTFLWREVSGSGRYRVRYNGNDRLIVIVNGFTTFTHGTDTSAGWHTLAILVDSSNLDVILDGTNINSDTGSGSTNLRNLRVGAEPQSPFEVCDAICWDGHTITEAEAGLWEDGPEYRYSSGASLSSTGDYDAGTWDLPSPFDGTLNGAKTYEWVIANAAGSVVDSGTGKTGTASIGSEAGNVVYFLVRVPNAAGNYDIGDKATRTSSYGSPGDGYYEIANVLAAGGGGADYTLTADAGSFTLSGVAAGLAASRTLTAAVGSFAVSGVSTGLIVSRTLAGQSQSYVFNFGNDDTSLLARRQLGSETGEFTLTGIGASLVYSQSYTLTCDTGAFTLAGEAAEILAGRRLGVSVGEFTVTGQDATLNYGQGYKLDAETGAFSLTGVDADLIASRTLTADAASFTLTGQAAGLYRGYTLSADAALFTLTGTGTGLSVSRSLVADTETFVLTGIAADLSANGPVVTAYFVCIRNASFSTATASATLSVAYANASIKC